MSYRLALYTLPLSLGTALSSPACVPVPFLHLRPSHIGFVALLSPHLHFTTSSEQHSQPLSTLIFKSRDTSTYSLGAFTGYSVILWCRDFRLCRTPISTL